MLLCVMEIQWINTLQHDNIYHGNLGDDDMMLDF